MQWRRRFYLSFDFYKQGFFQITRLVNKEMLLIENFIMFPCLFVSVLFDSLVEIKNINQNVVFIVLIYKKTTVLIYKKTTVLIYTKTTVLIYTKTTVYLDLRSWNDYPPSTAGTASDIRTDGFTQVLFVHVLLRFY